MWRDIADRLTSSRILLAALGGLLTLNLTNSMSMRYGHADVPIAATAAEIEPLGVGDSAPRFTVTAVDRKPYNFDPRALDRPVVAISFRGGWCPYCNMHLSELRGVVGEIEALGADTLFLSGDRPDLLLKSLQRETPEAIADLDYQLFSDADAQAAIAFGIAFRAADATIARRYEKGQDIAGSSMQRHGVLPVPSVFVIDRKGVIAFAYANPDYKVRLPADELLRVVADVTARK